LKPPAPDNSFAWFCVCSQTKHEHIAAEHLRRFEDVEVFLPRIRFKRTTRRGSEWVTEALFPSYLFARFDWHTALRKVHHAPGVSRVVHFGYHWPTVPAEVIDELRRHLGEEQVHVLDPSPDPGETVRIAGGAFHGLEAVVTQIMPGRERVRVLLDFLGRQTTVEVRVVSLVKEADRRKVLR
jgi:transcriptional antiterminator RfaH